MLFYYVDDIMLIGPGGQIHKERITLHLGKIDIHARRQKKNLTKKLRTLMKLV
jgi:hypothetical protein